MENIYCEKHRELASKIEKMADMGLIIDFPLCEQCDKLTFGEVIYIDDTCWNDDESACCKKEENLDK